jgi:hypothetical protein
MMSDDRATVERVMKLPMAPAAETSFGMSAGQPHRARALHELEGSRDRARRDRPAREPRWQAGEDWQQAFALSADGQYVLVGKIRLAKALVAAKDHAGVLATCAEVLEPRIIDLTIGAGIVPCLLWSAEAAEALDKREQAIALYRRVLVIRPALSDPQRQVASAALRRLIR